MSTGSTHIVHLAALQIPFCRADPALGARVNVVGTVNIFEAARRRLGQIRGLVYTSSIAVFDATDADARTGTIGDDAAAHPTTHYGVYKQANEGNARVYWGEAGLASVGLRPMTVFGPGRDQGLTSAPTKAVVAALTRPPVRDRVQRADPVPVHGRRRADARHRRPEWARRRPHLQPRWVIGDHRRGRGRDRCSRPGAAGLISVTGGPLPFPDDIDATGADTLGPLPITPIETAVTETAVFFRRLRRTASSTRPSRVSRLVEPAPGLRIEGGGRVPRRSRVATSCAPSSSPPRRTVPRPPC